MPKTIKRENPVVGTVFHKIFNGKLYTMTVVESSNGFAFKVDGQLFETPTAAAKSIQTTEVNGWKFWKMDKK